MRQKRILNPDRVRRPSGGFSFIPHRFLGEGFLKSLQPDELLLYVFLIIASDKNGISYYGVQSICSHLHMEENTFLKARDGLLEKDLIAFDGVFFQVLELPKRPVRIRQFTRKDLKSLCGSIGNGGQND